MTIDKLIKELQAIKLRHGGRVAVCADTLALRHTCNNVWQVVHISHVDSEDVRQVDGDGYGVTLKNGEEKHRFCVVLR